MLSEASASTNQQDPSSSQPAESLTSGNTQRAPEEMMSDFPESSIDNSK